MPFRNMIKEVDESTVVPWREIHAYQGNVDSACTSRPGLMQLVEDTCFGTDVHDKKTRAYWFPKKNKLFRGLLKKKQAISLLVSF